MIVLMVKIIIKMIKIITMTIIILIHLRIRQWLTLLGQEISTQPVDAKEH